MTKQLPEPAAYVLHKFIIFERRKIKSKKERDLLAAKDIGEFLLQNKTQRKKYYSTIIQLYKESRMCPYFNFK